MRDVKSTPEELAKHLEWKKEEQRKALVKQLLSLGRSTDNAISEAAKCMEFIFQTASPSAH